MFYTQKIPQKKFFPSKILKIFFIRDSTTRRNVYVLQVILYLLSQVKFHPNNTYHRAAFVYFALETIALNAFCYFTEVTNFCKRIIVFEIIQFLQNIWLFIWLFISILWASVCNRFKLQKDLLKQNFEFYFINTPALAKEFRDEIIQKNWRNAFLFNNL